ncbi:DUF4189 domain-containing protein [Nocardia australiensis]|uniref:DUF4189 domain-containing protein n=1 Tax=Nocardia australiensis TaxID=2887191 RepID=UPI001D13DA38|nr:DUF4189 domain-containing protein [Nocardia australiensis]
MKKFVTGAAIVAATVGSVLATAAPAQAQYGYYGAIAVAHNGDYAISNNYSSYAEAESNAVAGCGLGCEVLISWTNGCGVLASSSSQWSGAARASYSAARSAALSRLNGGYVVDWRCTSGYSL